MKTAFYTFEHKSGSKITKIDGQVTLKSDGKISISIPLAKRLSGAQRGQVRAFGEKIVKEGFVDPAIWSFKETKDCKGLIEELFKHTTDLKVEFLNITKEYANVFYEDAVKQSKRSLIEWFKAFRIPYKEVANGYVSPVNYNKEYYKMRSKMDIVNSLVRTGKEAFITKELKLAEKHYENSIERLATRLNDKGITEDSEFEITNGRVGQNFECYIKHENGITKAWTIIASGPIQRPHYRYLVN